MGWLERHAWWGLAFMSVVIVIFGMTDMAVGAPAEWAETQADVSPRMRLATIRG